MEAQSCPTENRYTDYTVTNSPDIGIKRNANTCQRTVRFG